MTESATIDPTQPRPHTVTSLAADLRAAGVVPGMTVLVHSALSKLGWVVGGPVAVVQALMQVITPDGTLMMPTHSTSNSDPRYWSNPPVPESWWQVIRDEMPAYDRAITPTRGMGAIVEAFRTFPNVIRSAHPAVSFAAWGAHAQRITYDHLPEQDVGEGSPLAHLYDLDGYVLLLGVDHGNNTSLHLSEARATFPGKAWTINGAAMLVDGVRQWVPHRILDFSDHDFADLGADYEREISYTPARVGFAEARLVRQRPLVDYGVTWIERHRGGRLVQSTETAG